MSRLPDSIDTSSSSVSSKRLLLFLREREHLFVSCCACDGAIAAATSSIAASQVLAVGDAWHVPQAAAVRLPNFCRFAFCASLRGGSLNSRAAVPPRMLCLPFSDRNGRSQIVDGRSKSQCG